MDELKTKIEEYQAKIDRLEANIPTIDQSTLFGQIEIVESKRTIDDYRDRIARLTARITGTQKTGPTEKQIRLAEYVNSSAYDND